MISAACPTTDRPTPHMRATQALFGFGVALAVFTVCSLSNPVAAQMDFSLDETEAQEKKAAKEEFGTSGTDIIDKLAAQDTGEVSDIENSSAKKESVEEIYAVQQVYALRLKRFELSTSAAFNLNDPYLSHPAAAVAFNYWWTNVLAIGVNFLWYDWSFLPRVDPTTAESLPFYVQRSTRLGVPLTQWQMGANLNFTYVPFYGKFSMFNKFIFQWDSYLVGGIGFMRTRPIPVFDPQNREFEYGMRAAFNVGLGIRIFVSRSFAIFGEFRNYMYLEKFENTNVDPLRANDKSTWFANGSTFTNNVSVQIGATVFFPLKVKYRLPK